MRDSLDKIIGVYLACVTEETFTYKKKEYHPKLLRVSPDILRDFSCPAMCGGCCSRFSLDYLPEPIEIHPYPLQERLVEINGKEHIIWSDIQAEPEYYCGNLDQTNGRCGIHMKHPFSCDFELIRFLEFADENRANALTQKLFGRGWAMKRIDGERGALCGIHPPSEESRKEVLRKLGRLQQWADYFEIPTKISKIALWVEKGPHNLPLLV